MTKAEKSAYMKAWRRTDAGIALERRLRQARTDYMREWNARNIDKRRASNRASRARNLDKVHEYQRSYRAKFHYKDRARTAVSVAVANGSLVRPSLCSDCGVACFPDGHHHLGYEQEHWLSVQWLCRICHRKADAGMGEK